jgi:hypothetical protein
MYVDEIENITSLHKAMPLLALNKYYGSRKLRFKTTDYKAFVEVLQYATSCSEKL